MTTSQDQAEMVLNEQVIPSVMHATVLEATRRMLMTWTLEHHTHPQLLYRSLIFNWLDAYRTRLESSHLPELAVFYWTERSHQFVIAYLGFLEQVVRQFELVYQAEADPENQLLARAREWQSNQAAAHEGGKAVLENHDLSTKIVVRCAYMMALMQDEVAQETQFVLAPEVQVELWAYLLAEMILGVDNKHTSYFQAVFTNWPQVYHHILEAFMPALTQVG